MRVLIADDHGILRQGLKSLLDGEEDIEVVGEACDGGEAVRLFMELSPDVVVMDVTMPEIDGIEATKRILLQNPRAKIVALSMHDEPFVVRETLKAGAAGFVLKSYLADEVVKAIRVTMQGGYYLSAKITDIVVEDYTARSAERYKGANTELTERDIAILTMVAEGKTVKQISRELHLSPKTAHANRHALMEKLDVESVAELTKYAIREGIVIL